MNCRKVREIMFLYTDNEMGEELLVSFREHLDLCPPCARRIDRAVQLITIVRERCTRTAAPPHLRHRILTSLPHRRI